MKEYIILAALMLGLPLLYWLILQWYKPGFSEERNKERKILKSAPEILVLVVSELSLLKLGYSYIAGHLPGITLGLLYVVLVIMSILCMTDYWERVVPNKILLILIVFGVLVVGFQGTRDMSIIPDLLTTMVVGFLFSLISFLSVYLLSKGSLGSGDVKLALLLGIFLTGEYVVRTIFYGCLVSALFSIIQLLRKKLTRKDEIPFVPFLYIGLIITYFMG